MLYPRPGHRVRRRARPAARWGAGSAPPVRAGFDRHLTTGEIVEQVVVASRARPGGRTPAEQRRVHGHGRAAGQRGVGVGGHRADPRRPRACRRGTSRCRRSASCRASAPSPRAACRSPSPSASTPPTTRCATSSCRSTAATRSTPSSTRCQQYLDATGRRVSFEWAMIDGVNDRPQRRRRARRAVPAGCARRRTST